MTANGARCGWIAAAVFALCAPGPAAAGPYRVGFEIEPTYTFCLSPQSCSPAARTALAAEYKPIVNRKLNLRVKLSRAYESSADDAALDDISAASNQRFQTATDSLDLRLRLFDGDGYETQEPKAGYSYQHPEGDSAAHHAAYASDSWFFGRRIQRGLDGPAHQFRVSLKLSKDTSQPAGTLPQTFVQAAGFVTFPLVASGSWRAETGYTIQQQTVVSGGLEPFSTRFSASLTHDFNANARAYLRVESRVSTGSNASLDNPRATSLVLGARFLF
jgi:hypothetical protein